VIIFKSEKLFHVEQFGGDWFENVPCGTIVITSQNVPRGTMTTGYIIRASGSAVGQSMAPYLRDAYHWTS